jgi:hypothetical protein
MPVKNKNNYSQKDFEKDLQELEQLIEQNQKGGNNNNNNNKNNNNNNKNKNNNNNQEEEDNDDEVLEEEEEEEDDDNNNQMGGLKDGHLRHFKLFEVNGQKVKLNGTANIKENQTPLNAAKKLLGSYCRSKNIKGSNRSKVHITFTIRETNRDSDKSRNVYGPYDGYYKKYDKKKVIKINGKTIEYTVEPIVKLHKEKSKGHKGGSDDSNPLLIAPKAEDQTGGSYHHKK